MEEIKFKSLTDLYQRLYPALKTKKEEIFHNYKMKINELDLWNYLKNNIWLKGNNLCLHDMVNDILFLNEEEFLKYLNNK